MEKLIGFMMNEEEYIRKLRNNPIEKYMSVDNTWQTAFEGHHRLLALRVLGSDFVKRSGMDRWVTVDLIKTPRAA